MRASILLAGLALIICDEVAPTHGAEPRSFAFASEPFNARAVDAERTRLVQRLHAAISEFDAELRNHSGPFRTDWHAYLKWETWAPVARGAEAFDVDAMKPIVKRFYAASQGFEHDLIDELRSALTDYITLEEAIRIAGGDLPGEYSRRFSRLQRAAFAAPPDYGELEEAAWWLTATNQAPRAMAQVRDHFSGPVIVGHVLRENVENKLDEFQSNAEEVQQVSNRIQGARVVGTATASSRTSAVLVDAATDARLRVTSTGVVSAPRNVATSGRVRVVSSSTTPFTAIADIYWDGKKFTASTPQVSAETRSTIRSIDAPWPLRRAASRRVHGGRRSAEAEAESLVEQRVAESMGVRLSQAVAKLNQRSAGFLGFLDRTGNGAVRWTTRLRPSAVQIGYMAPSPAGLGAPPREFPPLEGDETLGLSFHDAAIENMFRAQLAGARWSDVNFSILQRELTGGNSEEHLIGFDPQRWNVHWSWRLPVSIRFTDARALVCFRFSKVEIDGAPYDAPFEVRAQLKVVPTPLGHEMQTVAPAVVEGVDASRPLPPHFQEFLERKFRALFSERFHLDGLQFPAGGELDGMSGFRAIGARFEPHWVHLRYTNRKGRASLVVHEGEE